MKIMPDFEGRNDGYDNNTVRYYEKIYDDGYFYEVYVLIDGRKSRIVITKAGVSVDCLSEGITRTRLIPEQMFPGKKELGWGEIERIITKLENTAVEGTHYTALEMRDIYQQYLVEKLGEGKGINEQEATSEP